MIQSEIITPLVLTANNSVVTFQNDTLRTRSANCGKCGGWLQHNEGSPLYKIVEGGIYEITFTGTVTSATTGIVALGINQDGVLIPSTVGAETLATAGDLANITLNKAFRVCCNADTVITVESVPSVLAGATPTATATQIPTIINANLVITKKR